MKGQVNNPTFKQLNDGWNADPNAPEEDVQVISSTVRLTFYLNWFAYKAKAYELGRLTFEDCSMWRMGEINDHGWYGGQCRYSKVAPKWGEFYELIGDDDQRLGNDDWQKLGPLAREHRHFLFYLRDSTFECFAMTWKFERTDEGP